MSVRGDEVNWMVVELDRNRTRTDISVNWTELWTRLECMMSFLIFVVCRTFNYRIMISEEIKILENELRTVLADCSDHREDLDEPDFTLFDGDWDGEEILQDVCLVNSVYINGEGKVSFDLTRQSWNMDGDYCGEEVLEDVTLDYIYQRSLEDEFHIEFLK